MLRFVAKEAERAKRGGGDDDGGLTKRRTRVWYMPWKVHEETIDKNGEVVTTKRQVPQDWLQTDMTRGLSDIDVSTRRGEYGYNELESAHENMFLKVRSVCWPARIALTRRSSCPTSPAPSSTPWSSPSSSPPVFATGSTSV